MNPSTARPWQGIAFVMAAVACFVVLDSTAKYVSATVPVMVAVWLSSTIRDGLEIILINDLLAKALNVALSFPALLLNAYEKPLVATVLRAPPIAPVPE